MTIANGFIGLRYLRRGTIRSAPPWSLFICFGLAYPDLHLPIAVEDPSSNRPFTSAVVTYSVALQERDGLDGKVFDANVLTCDDNLLNAGESILVGSRAYRYDGDDNLGNSRFTGPEPFPEFELIEKPYKDLLIVLEIYPMQNGHFLRLAVCAKRCNLVRQLHAAAFQFRGRVRDARGSYAGRF